MLGSVPMLCPCYICFLATPLCIAITTNVHPILWRCLKSAVCERPLSQILNALRKESHNSFNSSYCEAVRDISLNHERGRRMKQNNRSRYKLAILCGFERKFCDGSNFILRKHILNRPGDKHLYITGRRVPANKVKPTKWRNIICGTLSPWERPLTNIMNGLSAFVAAIFLLVCGF